LILDLNDLFDSREKATDQALASTADVRRLPAPVPSARAEGWMESLALSPGCTLLRRTYRFHQHADGRRILLGEFGWTPPETTFLFHTVRGGVVGQLDEDMPGELIYRPEQGCFRRVDRRVQVTLWLERAASTNMAALVLSEARLVEWLGSSLAERLMERLELDSFGACVMPIPQAVTAPLHAALPGQVSGCLLRLSAQARLMDYLVGLCMHLGLADTGVQPRQRARDAARELNAYLGELEGKPPSLDALGARFGLSARRLNEAFVNEYGLPIHRFIADRRLAEAHQAVLESDVPLKQLAARLGYTHVNHFNSAFRRKFGYPPGSLRRGRPRTQDSSVDG
jgi:AraC-like DNA-binding protein